MLHLDHAYQKLDNEEDLDIAMSMYSLSEYSANYAITSENLWNCYRDEMNDDDNGNNVDNYRLDNSKTITSKYKNNRKQARCDRELAVPLKYLSLVWKPLGLCLINCCKREIDLPWSKNLHKF